jgi:hypothetical protein
MPPPAAENTKRQTRHAGGKIERDTLRISKFELPGAPAPGGVTDGTRTRNSQNHNLELYH